MTSLFDTLPLVGKILNNRIVMPPMTRSRSTQPGDVPNPLMATYYSQRASAGLIISEGTQISPLGKGYAWTPGIYSTEQIIGWCQVTDAVHAAGGTIFAQLWHVGRVSHPANTEGETPISPSAIQAKGVKVFIDDDGQTGFVDSVMPRAMSKADIDKVIAEYVQATLNAVSAGFDGIELHAANGYLINQFIDSQSNTRTDEYGGSLTNRLRFLSDVVAAVSDAIGSEKIGVRLAPLTTLNGTVDDNPQQTYEAIATLLNQYQVAYIHIAEADWDDAPLMPLDFKRSLRQRFGGVMIYAGKYDKSRAEIAIAEGWADMIGFGRPFVANPDLPHRLAQNLVLNTHQPDTLFGGDKKGYTDYPSAKEQFSSACA